MIAKIGQTTLALLMLAGLTADGFAQGRERRQSPAAAERAQPDNDNTERPGRGLLGLLPPDAITTQTMPDGQQYKAVAGTLPIFDGSGERKAAIFYTAYTLAGADPAKRPVTFAFNGGPGAASAYLHLGLAGPKAAQFGADARDGATPTLIDNPDSWLPFTDLVFIDPVSTGWSRAAKSDGAKEFHSVSGDAQAIAKIIALYVARNARTPSPKYLLGESYGGFRAAKVARVLQKDQGIVPAGIVMVAPFLESGYTFGGDEFSLGCALQFPSVAAAEMEARGVFDERNLATAERFAMTEYLVTLAGKPPEGDAAESFYKRIAAMTGLDMDTVIRTRGCVRDAYLKQRTPTQTLSNYDASFMSPNPYPESGNRRGPDPILDGYLRTLSGIFTDYARNVLGFRTDMTYTLLARDVRWDWESGGRGSQPGAHDDIRELLALNPSFRLLVMHGNADLITPHGVTRYLLDHLPPFAGPERVQLKVYRGGHMAYLRAESRAEMTRDARIFYQPE